MKNKVKNGEKTKLRISKQVAKSNLFCYIKDVEKEIEKQKKFYWHANTSSGGTLSLGVTLEGQFSDKEKKEVLAQAIDQCYENMENNGFIPFDARLMSPRDIANYYGKTRQYWEKLLNEGKILYKETSAGRITTDMWVRGYIGNKEQVDNYVKNVRTVLKEIDTLENKKRPWQKVNCPVCGNSTFEFHVNGDVSVNGICRNTGCGFYVHTII